MVRGRSFSDLKTAMFSDPKITTLQHQSITLEHRVLLDDWLANLLQAMRCDEEFGMVECR